MVEEWKNINDFYQVSNLGRVRSLDTTQIRSNGRVVCKFMIKGKILKPRFTGRDARVGRGYATVLIGGKNKKIHRLVAEAFIENPDNKPFINHIDGNKANNSVANLEWVTGSENIQHSLRTGLKPSGESVSNHKLTLNDVNFIRKNYVKGDYEYGAKPLARKFHISPETVKNIINSEKWRWC